jgi:hypothetical protein
LRWLIGAGVLLASALLACRASQRWLLLLVGGGAALIFWRWPPAGLVALVAASLVVPFEVGTGTQTTLNAAVLLVALLLGLWLLDVVVRRRRAWLLPSRPVYALLALVGAAVLAFLAGQLPWFPASAAPLFSQLGGLAVYGLSAGAFLLAAHQVRDRCWLERLTWVFLALGGLYVAGRLLPPLGRLTGGVFQRGSTGSLFWVWLVALASGQALFNRRLGDAWRLALGALAVAALYVGLVQSRSWASGWLPPVTALVAVLWAGAPRWRWGLVLVGVPAVALGWQRLFDLVMVNEEYSAMTRWEAWRILAEIVRVSPLLGLGPANYYWYTPLYPILGWHVRFNSHNQYVDLVAQTGILGLACFLWFAWETWRLGGGLRERLPDGFERAYVCGALGGLVGTMAAGMLADWVLPFVYNIGLFGFRASVLGWLFLGGLVCLEQLANEGATGAG